MLDIFLGTLGFLVLTSVTALSVGATFTGYVYQRWTRCLATAPLTLVLLSAWFTYTTWAVLPS